VNIPILAVKVLPHNPTILAQQYLVAGSELKKKITSYDIGNVIIPTDCHLFQRGRYTTNQIIVYDIIHGSGDVD
jgi:hypothetical protein